MEVKAERVGFEPTVQFNPYDDLANRSFRPLRHLSFPYYLREAKIKINCLTNPKKTNSKYQIDHSILEFGI